MLPTQNQKFDIVEQFSGDEDGSRLREVVQRLEQSQREYQQRLDDGVDEAEKKNLTAIVSAYGAALNALPELWERVRKEQA
jgi:hypothetical protein